MICKTTTEHLIPAMVMPALGNELQNHQLTFRPWIQPHEQVHHPSHHSNTLARFLPIRINTRIRDPIHRLCQPHILLLMRPLASWYAMVLLSSGGLDEFSSSLGLTSDTTEVVLAVSRRWRIRDAWYSIDWSTSSSVNRNASSFDVGASRQTTSSICNTS